MKVTAVELTDLADTDSKEEQDAATAVDNICYERVPGKLNIIASACNQVSHVFVNKGYEGRDLRHSQAPTLQVLGGVNIIYDAKMANHSLLQIVDSSGRD